MDISFIIQIDCEATDPAFDNPALGQRAVRGFAGLLAEQGFKATFAVVPSDMRAHGPLYRELHAQGHEIGLHMHPATLGYGDFLGVYGFEEQVEILRTGMEIFAGEMGFEPKDFTPGYASANDYTYPALESLGFTHGLVSIPTRNLPQCACVWSGSPLSIHYPHRYNRLLTGNVDFVEIPSTVDVDSRMWGGAHPQDLRIELVDAKNHWYTIHKNVKRQVLAGETIPVKHLVACTHNTFDYSDHRDFRRETLLGVLAAARQICETEEVNLVPSTMGEAAARYREQVALPQEGAALKLDTRGRAFLSGRKL
jgi:peptidoglycan/xylan/chitin deacetylase (PgdA/CDA1 family)